MSGSAATSGPWNATAVEKGNDRNFSALLFAFLLARLLAWAFLLPPWAGFDEPQHQGYVEACRERVFWPAYRAITIPDRLISEIHRWPLPHRGPRATSERVGETAPAVRAPIPNYETQQSPLYYLVAGRVLALLPPLAPIGELYLLRLANVAMAFVVGWLACRCAAALRFGPASWLPAALLAFVPGYGIAMIRVTNDALCALLLSVALSATTGFPKGSGRSAFVASLAGGLAPWAKLYGWVGVPSVGGWALRRRSPRLLRLACLALLLVPGLLLAWVSWKLNGHALPIQENLRPSGHPPLSEVPWLRDAWVIAKTFVWVSGASSLVFPNGIYLMSVLLLAAGLVLTMAMVRDGRDKLVLLGLPVLLFGLAMAYHSWRILAAYGRNGSLGWYLWALALPLGLLTTWGVTRSRRARRLLPLVLGFFLALTILADVVQVLDTAGMLVTTPNLHLLGVRGFAAGDLTRRFFASRPAPAAAAAIACAAGSWLLGGLAVARCFRPRER